APVGSIGGSARTFTPSAASSSSERGEAVPEFRINVAASRDGRGNFGANELPITFAQTMDEHGHGSARDPEQGRETIVIARGRARVEKRLEQRERFRVARRFVLALQLSHRAPEQRERPLTIVIRARVGTAAKLGLVLRRERVPGN